MVNFVNLTTVLAGGIFLVSNFQNQVMDLAFGNSTNLTPVSMDTNNGGGSNQHWSFAATGTNNEFIISNIFAPGVFLSYASAFTGAVAVHSQTVGSTEDATIWDLTPTDSTGVNFKLNEHVSGLFLTAWNGSNSPLTLEIAGIAVQQTFSLTSGK